MRKALVLILSAVLTASLSLHGQESHYIEEPAHGATQDGIHYVTTFALIGESDAPVRSFTYKYDTSRRIALWVAYPLNASLIGTGSRGEGWAPDPAVPEDRQAILYKGFRYGSSYDTGHQIPSADRLDPDANAQTCRFTNATPQLHDFNGGIWAELEKVVRTWAKRSDTLYVVTGCIPGEETIEDNAGENVTIPSAYYKAVLRLNRDKRGTPHWSACAVLLPHEVVEVKTWQQNLAFFKEHSLSLCELERLTGEVFYPNAASVVGKTQLLEMKNTSPADTPWWWK